MRKPSTTALFRRRKLHDGQLTVGLDLGDRSSFYCVLNRVGEVILEERVATNPEAMKKTFEKMPASRIALETGTHSPWINRLLTELGHEAIVAHSSNVRLIGESRRKDDRLDAQALARLARIDPKLLSPIQHRSAQAQADLAVIRARYALVRARTALVCSARGLTKSFGERIRGRNPKGFSSATSEALSPHLQIALAPLLSALEAVTARIREYDAQNEQLAEQSYPEVALLKQSQGCRDTDCVDIHPDTGRSKAVSKEPRCWLLCRAAAGKTELRGKRTSTAYHERRRLLSADGSGPRRTTYPGTVRRGLRSAPVGTEAGRTWRQKW
jgi:transposase